MASSTKYRKNEMFNNDLNVGRKSAWSALHMPTTVDHSEGQYWMITFSNQVLEAFWQDMLVEYGYREISRQVVTEQSSMVGRPCRHIKSAIIQAVKVDRSRWRSIGLKGSNAVKLGRCFAWTVRSTFKVGTDVMAYMNRGEIDECARRSISVVWNVREAPKKAQVPVGYEPVKQFVLLTFAKRKTRPDLSAVIPVGKWRSHSIHPSQFSPTKDAL